MKIFLALFLARAALAFDFTFGGFEWQPKSDVVPGVYDSTGKHATMLTPRKAFAHEGVRVVEKKKVAEVPDSRAAVIDNIESTSDERSLPYGHNRHGYGHNRYGGPAPHGSYHGGPHHGAPHHGGPHHGSGYHDTYRNPEYKSESLLKRTFSDNKNKFDPKDKNEDLQWDNLNQNHPADDPDIDPNLYFNNAHTKQETDHWSATTIPFRVTKPNTERAETSVGVEMNVGIFDKYEASMSTQSWKVEYGEKIIGKARISAETIGTEHHPFDDELVTDAQDDFRLASSAFSLISVDPVPINAGFALTNKGLWAVYVVSGDPNDESIQAFVQTKRIATRASRTAVHNVAVEYDQSYNKLTWFVEGKPVYWVESVGLPAYDPYTVTIQRSTGSRTRVVKPKEVEFNVGSFSYLMATDPNDRRSYTALVRLNADFPLAQEIKVYDDESFLMSRVWGQGAIFRLYDIEVNKISPYYPKHGYRHPYPPTYPSPYEQPYLGPYERKVPEASAAKDTLEGRLGLNTEEKYVMPAFDLSFRR